MKKQLSNSRESKSVNQESTHSVRNYSATTASIGIESGFSLASFNNTIPLEPAETLKNIDQEARYRVISQLQSHQGNHYVKRVLSSGQYSKSGNHDDLQRASPDVMEMEPITITADPLEARVKFARARESIGHYSDNSLDYFSNQYYAALISFQSWYGQKERADTNYFNAVIDLLRVAAGALGPTGVGIGANVIGIIIKAVAVDSANAIQRGRDDFADSLLLSANNFQAGINRRLRGKVPTLLENNDPATWEEIEMLAVSGEEWQPLLHDRAGLPRPGENYQTSLLGQLIFSYNQWELQQRSRMYQGIYSMADPELAHMRGRSQAEAYLKSGLPIPRNLADYARPGEQVATD